MSFIKDVENFFDKVFKSTSVEQKILAATGALAPLVETGLAVEDPQAAPVVTAVFKTVQTDLGTFVAIVQTRSLRPAQPKTLHARAREESLAVLPATSACSPVPRKSLFRLRTPPARFSSAFIVSALFGAAPDPRGRFFFRIDPRGNHLDPGPLFDRFPHPDRGWTLCNKSPGG
ncbi:MAG: hypothetical protein WA400_06595 [Silvibacterium sp.]